MSEMQRISTQGTSGIQTGVNDSQTDSDPSLSEENKKKFSDIQSLRGRIDSSHPSFASNQGQTMDSSRQVSEHMTGVQNSVNAMSIRELGNMLRDAVMRTLRETIDISRQAQEEPRRRTQTASEPSFNETPTQSNFNFNQRSQ